MELLQQTQTEEKREFWTRHMEGWQNAGISQAAYCAQQGLKLATFGYWRRRLKEANHGQLRLVPLVDHGPMAKSRGNSGTVHLCYQGFKIELEEDFSEDTLRRLLDVLR